MYLCWPRIGEFSGPYLDVGTIEITETRGGPKRGHAARLLVGG